MVSYSLDLSELKNVKAFSTNLESTSQVFAYGHDLFFQKVNPDKAFDIIDDEFPFTLLFLGIAALYAVDYAIKTYMKDRADRKVFLLG